MWALPCACSYALFACARIVHVFCPSRCSDSDLHAVGVRINIECANDPRHGNNTEHATNGCNGCNGRNGWNANKSTNVSKCAQSDAVLAARPFHPSKNASLAPRVPISTVSKPSEPCCRRPGQDVAAAVGPHAAADAVRGLEHDEVARRLQSLRAIEARDARADDCDAGRAGVMAAAAVRQQSSWSAGIGCQRSCQPIDSRNALQ